MGTLRWSPWPGTIQPALGPPAPMGGSGAAPAAAAALAAGCSRQPFPGGAATGRETDHSGACTTQICPRVGSALHIRTVGFTARSELLGKTWSHHVQPGLSRGRLARAGRAWRLPEGHLLCSPKASPARCTDLAPARQAAELAARCAQQTPPSLHSPSHAWVTSGSCTSGLLCSPVLLPLPVRATAPSQPSRAGSFAVVDMTSRGVPRQLPPAQWGPRVNSAPGH